MILYHGTSARHLPAILENGIQPRGHKPSLWKAAPSRNDCVYLTNAYPAYFAQSAAKGDDHLLVVECCVSPLFLLPDEDWLEQVSRKNGPAPIGKSMKVRTAWYRHRLGRFQSHCLDSLAGIGNAAHMGAVEPTAIKRYATFPQELYTAMCWAGHDPMISVMNYRYLSDKYTGWVKWIFGDGPLPVKVPETFKINRDEIKVVTT